MQLIKSHHEKHELTKLAYYCVAFENATYYGNNFIFQKGYSRAFISTYSGKFNKSEINEKRYALHQLVVVFIMPLNSNNVNV